MKIEARKVVTLEYDLYVDGENGQEELMEKATAEAPLVYCHGEGMMLPAFEAQMAGLAEGDSFDFCIACEDAYGEYDDECRNLHFNTNRGSKRKWREGNSSPIEEPHNW